MTTQAQNFIDLCRGGNPMTVYELLKFQSNSIKKELIEKYGTTDMHELAIRISR